MVAHTVVHRFGVVLAVLSAAFFAAVYLLMRDSLIDGDSVYFAAAAVAAGLIIYGLCRAFGWIVGGFSQPQP
ncbi:hypothetical protein [Methylobacterium haplocladii]|uniref:Uncharacterized protein n=1 Tax=Methylobacterium haplocladii TaxID=1176176 RepID=A0A512INR9_9HYPH|nr:hypothetical protein [Methylobacterium haplocladii]GEO99278.1 hypothetical protein MHA02_16660 [Methylobacterium haplocladii]GJD83521.1 hypothetical protein HPGCJGGD_1390 [Methylobacterium haplocladii]